MTYTLHLGDCLEVLKTLPDASVDSVVTDPPYGLSFMGKKWDYDVPTVEVWIECLRVLKPGGHLLAFAGTRTQHRMAVRIEDAGFEIRDMIAWVYGSGFPKSMDVSKAIDRAAGAEREMVGQRVYGDGHVQNSTKLAPPIGTFQRTQDERLETAPATPEAQQWAGWGTALKPAMEPITMARKPLEGTVAANVLAHGTGAINIDKCRIGASGEDFSNLKGRPLMKINNRRTDEESLNGAAQQEALRKLKDLGRWPSNLIHDGSEEVMGLFPNSGNGPGLPKIAKRARNKGWANSSPGDGVEAIDNYGDTGSAARFFYTAKANKSDREKNNNHPTVKPTDLMRYLCRLVTPPGGIVLDPFMGSGSTGKAAMLEGFDFIGIEREQASYDTAEARLSRAASAGHQLGLNL